MHRVHINTEQTYNLDLTIWKKDKNNMTNLVPITSFDVVFISYDEPNADANYNDLLSKCPWAKRSHGVWGSDAAHKAAAAMSDTDRFITIDADNIVHDDFFNIELDMSCIGDTDVISWAAKNQVNGLVYGNGGIKCWPKRVVENMRTHEAAPEHDTRAQVDFCWNINYIQMNNVYCDVYNNASPYQAYRAGFREGCKMSLEGGDIVDKHQLKHIHKNNYNRMLIWMSVGADTLNGLWAIYGARLGCYMTNLQRDDWDWRDVRDFEWHTKFWNEKIAPEFETEIGEMCINTGYVWDKNALELEIVRLGEILQTELDLEFTDLGISQSRFFKAVYVNPARVAPMAREDNVINGIENDT